MHDKILAIHDGHTATAALIQDGKIHIVTLTYRLMIIGLVSYAIYLRQGVFSNYS